MAEILWQEPVEFAAGDTLLFEKHLVEFPRSKGWSLEYVLYGIDGQPADITLTSADPGDDSDDHLINSAGFGATLDNGEYILAGYAINATSAPGGGPERHQIYRGEFNLSENLPSGAAIDDQRTLAQKMLWVLEAKMLRLESFDLSESDVQRTRFVIEERNKAMDRWKYWREFRNYEVKIERAKNTGQNQNQIRPVFDCG
jgi:hypothetical protein